MIALTLSACKTVPGTRSAVVVTPVSQGLPVAGDSLILVHGKVFHPTDSIDGIPGVEISYWSLGADSASKASTTITDAKGEYQVRISPHCLYQITVRKEGRNIETQEFALEYGANNSIEKNFDIGYIEPDEDDYRREGWPALYFDIYRATLRPKSRANLDTMATIMHNEPRLRMLVEGHADPLEAPFNQRNKLQYLEQLGQQRVLAATRYLREYGVPDSCIESVSYGGRRPAAPSDLPENRQLNRRVEVKAVYVKGVRNGYGDLKLKFADLLKTIPGKLSKEEAQTASKLVNKSSAKNKQSIPKSGRKVSGAGR